MALPMMGAPQAIASNPTSPKLSPFLVVGKQKTSIEL